LLVHRLLVCSYFLPPSVLINRIDPYIDGVYKVAEIKPTVIKSVLDDPRVQKSIRRLKSMGLGVYAYLKNEDEAVILIDELSIINYIIRKIQEAVTYPNKKVFYDNTNKVIRIEVWRSGKA